MFCAALAHPVVPEHQAQAVERLGRLPQRQTEVARTGLAQVVPEEVQPEVLEVAELGKEEPERLATLLAQCGLPSVLCVWWWLLQVQVELGEGFEHLEAEAQVLEPTWPELALREAHVQD